MRWLPDDWCETDEMVTWRLVWDWWDGYLTTGVRLMRWLPDDWCETDEMVTWWLVWDWWDGYLTTGVRLMRWLPDDWCKRAEGFLVGTLHVRAAVSDNSRLKETATKLMSTASSQHFTSLQHCICHMLRHLQTHTTAKHKLCRSAWWAIGGMLIRLS